MSDAILLHNAAGDSAEIAPLGAELASWRVGGVDLIWAKDANVWDQTAPILFPVVGATREARIRVGDKTYPLGLHGFAWKKRFIIAERRDDYLRLALEDDTETRALYPFAFRLEIEFRLGPSALENSLVVTNTGATPLPYACGVHPAFRWPLAGSTAEHCIEFEKDERASVPIIAPGGLFTRRKRPVALMDRRLPLSGALMTHEALCFLDARSRRLDFDNGAGARLVAELEDFPHIALWSLPPAPFLCIEAWTGHGDPEGFMGDLFEKPSMRILAPGERARHGAVFAFEKDALRG